MTNTIDRIMEKVREYASTWGFINGPFDNHQEERQQLETELKALIATAVHIPIHPELAFAKLYEFTDIGQVLITIGENDDDNPTVYFRFQYNGLDFNPSLSFANTELGSEASCKYFEELTREKAYTVASNTIASIQEAML